MDSRLFLMMRGIIAARITRLIQGKLVIACRRNKSLICSFGCWVSNWTEFILMGA